MMMHDDVECGPNQSPVLGMSTLQRPSLQIPYPFLRTDNGYIDMHGPAGSLYSNAVVIYSYK
jgi:hypothetical protein